MPFVDGEPIDASKLGALETQLNELKATMPKIGASTTTVTVGGSNTGVGNSGSVVTNVPQIFGGVTGEISLSPNSYKTFPINYSAAGLTAAPKAIILTPIAPSSVRSINQAAILAGSITATGATGQVYHRSDATAVKVKYYFMVITF